MGVQDEAAVRRGSDSGESNAKNLDPADYRQPHVALGPQSSEQIRVLHPASLGVLRGICVSRPSSSRTRETRMVWILGITAGGGIAATILIGVGSVVAGDQI